MPITKEENPVAIPLQAYKDFMTALDMPRTLKEGTKAVRAKCKGGTNNKYLPQEAEESQASYDARVLRSVLLNVYGRTIEKLTGEVFLVPVTTQDTTEEVEEWTKNIDLEGNSLNKFAQVLFEQGISDGVAHILIDYEAATIKEDDGVLYYLDEETQEWDVLTKATQKDLGWRPYWVHVKPDQVIGWRFERVKGVKTLVQLRIKELVEVPDGEYGVKQIERVRVLTPGKYVIWEKQENERGEEEWVIISEGNTSLENIPLVTIMFGDKVTDMTAKPPLQNLADLNLVHFQSSSDQRNILHYARLVTWFGKMLDKDDNGNIIFGANRLIHSDNPDADLHTVEHSGNAIGAGRQDLQDLETQMAMFGLTYMMPKTGNTTATEKAIDSSENDSALVIWARGLKNALDLCLDYTGLLIGAEPGTNGSVEVNTEFKNFLSDTDAKVLLDSVTTGFLPKELVFDEFKRRGLINDKADWLEVKAMLEAEARDLIGVSDTFEE